MSIPGGEVLSLAARYVNRELLAVFLVTLVMLLLVAVGGRFIGYLQEAAMGKFTGLTVVTLVGLRLPEFIQIVAPFAVYIAILLTLGRLHADREMVVLQGAGTGTGRLLRWVGFTLSIVTLAVAALTLFLTPLSQTALLEFMTKLRSVSEFETLNAGTFHIYDRGNRVTYSESMSDDRRVLHEVFISQRLEDGRQVTVWAERGTQTIDPESQAHYLVLTNGRRYEGVPGDPGFRIMEFSELNQKLEVLQKGNDDLALEAQPLLTLGGNAREVAELHWRIGLPLFCVVGGLIAVGISRVKPRQGRFARVVPGMLIMLLYYMTLLINKSAVAEEQLPSLLGLWPAHVLFGGIAGWLLLDVGKPVRS